MITNTINIIELIWTLCSVLGLIFNVQRFYEANLDLAALNAVGLNGPRRIIATGNIRNAALSGIVLLLHVVLGIVAMTTPSANNQLTPLAYMYGFIIISISGIMSLKAWLDSAERRMIMKKYRSVDSSTEQHLAILGKMRDQIQRGEELQATRSEQQLAEATNLTEQREVLAEMRTTLHPREVD